MSDALRMKRTAGPFYMGRLRYRLGFHWNEEWEARPGYTEVQVSAPPSWKLGPHAGVVGQWRKLGQRLQWFGVPLTRWHEGNVKFYPKKKRRTHT